jgi:hypothetical protein
MTRNEEPGPAFDRRLLWGLLPACQLLALPAFGACPAGTVELRPNVRALPPRSIAMLNATTMKFSATSWNAGDGKLELVPRNPFTDADGNTKQPIDQKVYCSDGSNFLRPAGNAVYHAAHSHVHFADYANYILEQDTATPQNPRKGTKTTFCIMDTTGVNTQLKGASGSSVFAWCPTQETEFDMQGMSIGWGDTYGAELSGQSMFIGDLAAGMYRLRHVFDPKNVLLETNDGDNESCRRVEIGDGANGRFVTDRGPCSAPPTPSIISISPATQVHNTCRSVTISGANLAPELRVTFVGGTGPLPSIKNTTFDVAGNYITGTVCVPRARKGRNGGIGTNPVWDVRVTASFGGYPTVTKADLFRVTL